MKIGRIWFLGFDLALIALVAVLAWWAWQYHLTQSRDVSSTHVPTIPHEKLEPNDWSDWLAFPPEPIRPPRLRPLPPVHVAALMDSVYQQSQVTRYYDPSYVPIAYPGGDVDPAVGVCTDVIVRAFREQGVDLQKNVHEDMRRAFRKYPNKWGLKRPDTNIDHRRVPNLMTYFERKGKSLSVSNDPSNYLTGDVVVWELPNGQHHIGLVMAERSYDEERPLIGHNVNAGTNIEDVLFAWPIVGHYRYFEPPMIAAELKESLL